VLGVAGSARPTVFFERNMILDKFLSAGGDQLLFFQSVSG
jgi:hypothetical protein